MDYLISPSCYATRYQQERLPDFETLSIDWCSKYCHELHTIWLAVLNGNPPDSYNKIRKYPENVTWNQCLMIES